MLHELWDEENEQTFCLAGPMGDGARSWLGTTARLTWTVEASSHIEAMQLYYDHMGWGTYKSDWPDLDTEPYASKGWELAFATRADGQIDATLEGDWPLFNEALSDSISSLPPMGTTESGPSSYWLEVAANTLDRLEVAASEGVIASGNWTSIQLLDGNIAAANDYADPADAETVSVEAYPALLAEWRNRIRQSDAKSELPQTYRRNAAAPIDEPSRQEVEQKWRELLAGASSREEIAAWARLWVWAPMKVEAEVLVMSALQALDGFDMTHDLAKPNLIRHGGDGPGRRYYHSDDHVRGELERWLTALETEPVDPRL